MIFPKTGSRLIFVMAVFVVASSISLSYAASSEESSGMINDPTGFSILEAGEKGMFNIGPAIGDVVSEREESAGKEVLKFDYTIFPGGIVGVWTKTYPPKFRADAVDAARIAVKTTDEAQLRQISVKAEIKGENDMQTIPLTIGRGWSRKEASIDWNKIGSLKEVVFVVSPMDAGKRLEGILYFDVDFYRLDILRKYIVFVKALAVAALAVLASLAVFLLGLLFRVPRRGITRTADKTSPVGPSGSFMSGLGRDLLYGVVAVLIGACTIGIYVSGARSAMGSGAGYGFLVVALAGAVIAGLLKSAITGKRLTPSETFIDILFSGLLAAASSGSQAVLQSPSSWAQMLMFSSWAAAVAFAVYHTANARSIVSSGRHLRAVSCCLIAGTPYLFNWLLLMVNPGMLRMIGSGATLGILSSLPKAADMLGRIIVMMVFNEIVINGISLATKDRLVKTAKSHLFMLLVSLGVVVAPLVADAGSSSAVKSLPFVLEALAAVLATALSFAGLWAEVYLITGALLDGGHKAAPTDETIFRHVNAGAKKGMAYSAILLGMLYVTYMVVGSGASKIVMSSAPIVIGAVAGALLFPLLKTIIETFDGSLRFFERARYSYRDWSLYLRGAIAGAGFSYAMTREMALWAHSHRILFGCVIGILASGGSSLARDAAWAIQRKGRIQTWRLYFVDSCLGAFVGSAVAFYLDSLQIPVIIDKFKLYVSSGMQPQNYVTYPLVNNWGRIDLGSYAGGAKLLFTESLAGVINWSIAAWLFAINKVFMQAYFEKDASPIRFFFSRAGFAQLIEHMIYVLRWGLWMSPIIFTFLRMMPDPTWYNQDGMIHTFACVIGNLTMTPEAFRAWSLQVFVWIIAIDWFRVLIWMDHMGLRVATLVNLSFLGMDRLDERIGRFIGKASAQRYIPEGVKRFATWAPLLIPFYLPRGNDWNYVWNTSQAMKEAAKGKGLIPALQDMSAPEIFAACLAAVVVSTAVSFGIRALSRRSRAAKTASHELVNREYKTVFSSNGASYSELTGRECDISRRSYDTVDPCGRILYMLDSSEPAGSPDRYWAVAGNFPKDKFGPSYTEKDADSITILNDNHNIRTRIEVTLPDQDATAEIWDICVDNLSAKPRSLKVVPYLEWVLNGGLHDRFHTQYQRLYPEMEYVSSANAIIAWQKSTKSAGFIASDAAPEGFSSSRFDFIGRARSIWSPRILETMDFLPAKDTAGYPTFDPIGSLVVDAQVGPRASFRMRLIIGYAENRDSAVATVKKYLKTQPALPSAATGKKRALLIGHGEIPPGVSMPYSEFADKGNKLVVRTPFTPRPIDHAVSNAVHSVMVTNRGLHTSCNGNSQQNRLTPDWADTVTREIPSEAIYLFDPESRDWYSPTYHPLNDTRAKYECEFAVDGTAVFRMTRDTLSTELAVFVPPHESVGVYLLTVKNAAALPRKIRIAPYFQMVLGFMPEKAGPLPKRYDARLDALFFENPRNIFRSGPAFASMSIKSDKFETKRGRFFGEGRSPARPFMVEEGMSDPSAISDPGQIAAFLGTVDIPARGERTVAIILGQTDHIKEALPIIRKYKDVEAAKKSLEQTRGWWLSLMSTLSVETTEPEFDRYQNWLKYQALAERIWARRGFYQTSGAYGFRDQLQDTVNLIWVDPALARKQIILHASQQFIEGDVFHWFFTLTDGRMAFSCRSHASDNPVWLAWGVAEYVRMTGDYSILDEMTQYAYSEFPFADLPRNKQGWGHLYHRTTRSDTVYRHCMRSIDLILDKRTGKNGLPLMQTGDWNDGLDEIGSEGRGESVWLGFFLYYILREMLGIIEKKDGRARAERYAGKMKALEASLEKMWRGDRYLRAIHDDGTEIGVKDSGIWEIDALTASWAVMSGINFERGVTIFNTALNILEKGNEILLGWPALKEDTKPYLGRSSKYPEGVRENGMYCHGVQWIIRAARIIAEEFDKRSDHARADEYRATAYRLWLKVSPIPHVRGSGIEIYGGQPNKQAADMLTNFEPGRMIWHGYTGAAGWMLRQAMEGIVGASMIKNGVILPSDLNKKRGDLKVKCLDRDVSRSPIKALKEC